LYLKNRIIIYLMDKCKKLNSLNMVSEAKRTRLKQLKKSSEGHRLHMFEYTAENSHFTHTHTHTRLTALFRDNLGKPVPER